jgi:hypothetical protein
MTRFTVGLIAVLLAVFATSALAKEPAGRPFPALAISPPPIELARGLPLVSTIAFETGARARPDLELAPSARASLDPNDVSLLSVLPSIGEATSLSRLAEFSPSSGLVDLPAPSFPAPDEAEPRFVLIGDTTPIDLASLSGAYLSGR